VSYGDSDFRAAVREVLADVLGLPTDTLNYITQYAAMNPLPIPISQITGFTQFTGKTSTRRDSPVHRLGRLREPRYDGADSDWVDGRVVAVHSRRVDRHERCVQTGVDVDRRERCRRADDDGCLNEATTATSCAVANLKTLDNGGSSTVTCKYRADVGATGGSDIVF
jgi:hypothetical protein